MSKYIPLIEELSDLSTIKGSPTLVSNLTKETKHDENNELSIIKDELERIKKELDKKERSHKKQNKKNHRKIKKMQKLGMINIKKDELDDVMGNLSKTIHQMKDDYHGERCGCNLSVKRVQFSEDIFKTPSVGDKITLSSLSGISEPILKKTHIELAEAYSCVIVQISRLNKELELEKEKVRTLTKVIVSQEYIITLLK